MSAISCKNVCLCEGAKATKLEETEKYTCEVDRDDDGELLIRLLFGLQCIILAAECRAGASSIVGLDSLDGSPQTRSQHEKTEEEAANR